MPASLRALGLSVAFACLAFEPSEAATDWKPIAPADLALSAPRVQSDADAEALLWEVRVSDELGGTLQLEASTVFDHYVRIKVFTDRGREAYATVDIPYANGMEVRDVGARTIRPDGSIVELKRSDIYKRTIVKANDLKVSAISFAVPAIEKGVLVEYRWREVYRDSLISYLRLPFSREIPVHSVRYFVRPLSLPGVSMAAMPFNGTFSAPERQNDGFTLVSLTNVPAERQEAYAPPEFERRPWLFLYYTDARSPRGAEFWQRFSKELHDEYGRRSSPNDEIRKLAATAIAGATSDAEKLSALVRAARSRVKRVDVDTAEPAERQKARDNRNAGDVLKRGVGTGDDMVLLVLALAKAAGLDARIAAAPNRAEVFHKPAAHANPFFVRGRLVAIRSGERWLFAEPGNEHSDAGALSWWHEWEETLIGDPKAIVSARTPLSTPADSLKRRTATFTLLEDGTLEGECRVTYSGHWAQLFREQEDQDTPAEREESLESMLAERLPELELSDVRIEHVTDPDKPYSNSYKMRVTGYAQRTGTRLFLQPAVFQKGVGAPFSSQNRTTDVYFPFAWTEQDEITITLPDGYTLEQPERPGTIDAGAGSYAFDLAVKKDPSGRTQVILKRTFVFGVGENIFFRQTAYPQIKRFFDQVVEGDGHTLVLRKAGGGQ